jgi:hypothetical protein
MQMVFVGGETGAGGQRISVLGASVPLPAPRIVIPTGLVYSPVSSRGHNSDL